MREDVSQTQRARIAAAAARLRAIAERDDSIVAGTLSYLFGAQFALLGAIDAGYQEGQFARPLSVMRDVADILAGTPTADPDSHSFVARRLAPLRSPDGGSWLAGWHLNNALHRLAAAADRMKESGSTRVDPGPRKPDPVDCLYDLCVAAVRGNAAQWNAQHEEREGWAAKASERLDQRERTQRAPRNPQTRAVIEQLRSASSLTEGELKKLAERAVRMLDQVGIEVYGSREDWLIRLTCKQVNNLKHAPSGLTSWRRIGVEEALEVLEQLVKISLDDAGVSDLPAS